MIIEGNYVVKVSCLSLLLLKMNFPSVILQLFATFQPLNVEQYDMICNISNELRSYAPDVRILTTYYCGECKTKYDGIFSFLDDVFSRTTQESFVSFH